MRVCYIRGKCLVFSMTQTDSWEFTLAKALKAERPTAAIEKVIPSFAFLLGQLFTKVSLGFFIGWLRILVWQRGPSLEVASLHPRREEVPA